jgi:hypothetical protein
VAGVTARRSARPAALEARGFVFEENEVVKTARLRLSRLSDTDLKAMTSWLADSLAPEWSLSDLQAAASGGRGVLVSAGGEPMGLAVVALDAPVAGGASVPFISIAPERRFRGLGGEAGLALERQLRRKLGIERIYAPVPDGRGLAVYFWLRLGYRPLTAGEAPWPLVGLNGVSAKGIWLVREDDTSC